MTDRHHRAPHGRGQALSLRGEGRLFREDRRVFDGFADEVLAGRGRTGERGAGAPPGRESGALGSRVPEPTTAGAGKDGWEAPPIEYGTINRTALTAA